MVILLLYLSNTFQSTPSVGRATITTTTHQAPTPYFNPRPPWGGRHERELICEVVMAISIHALRGEGDVSFCGKKEKSSISIHALRGEGDEQKSKEAIKKNISIHALRGEGDGAWGQPKRFHNYFNPRPPWGGRLGRL